MLFCTHSMPNANGGSALLQEGDTSKHETSHKMGHAAWLQTSKRRCTQTKETSNKLSAAVAQQQHARQGLPRALAEGRVQVVQEPGEPPDVRVRDRDVEAGASGDAEASGYQVRQVPQDALRGHSEKRISIAVRTHRASGFVVLRAPSVFGAPVDRAATIASAHHSSLLRTTGTWHQLVGHVAPDAVQVLDALAHLQQRHAPGQDVHPEIRLAGGGTTASESARMAAVKRIAVRAHEILAQAPRRARDQVTDSAVRVAATAVLGIGELLRVPMMLLEGSGLCERGQQVTLVAVRSDEDHREMADQLLGSALVLHARADLVWTDPSCNDVLRQAVCTFLMLH